MSVFEIDPIELGGNIDSFLPLPTGLVQLAE
jgi:hypothetical protein